MACLSLAATLLHNANFHIQMTSDNIVHASFTTSQNPSPDDGSSSVEIRVTPHLPLKRDTHFVPATIEWSGVERPRPFDRIIFVANNPSLLELGPQTLHPSDKYVFMSELKSYEWVNGSGTVEMELVNARSRASYVVYTGLCPNNRGMCILGSTQVVWDEAQAPAQFRIGLTGVPGQLLVKWNSGVASSESCPPSVIWGLDPNDLTRESTGITLAYDYSDMCWPPANLASNDYKPGYEHEVVLKDIPDGVRLVWYKAGHKCAGGWSAAIPASVPSPVKESTKFIALADLAVTCDWCNYWPRYLAAPGRVQKAVFSYFDTHRLEDLDFIFMNGDYGYACGSHPFIWDYFFLQWDHVTRSLPLLGSAGNHEILVPSMDFPPELRELGSGYAYKNDAGGECGVPYKYRLRFPTDAVKAGNYADGLRLLPQELDTAWYDVVVGVVHHVVMSFEHNWLPGSDQYEWMVDVLTSGIDRSNTPWVMVWMHRPMYSTVVNDYDAHQVAKALEVWEDILISTGVDIVMQAHMHQYERTCHVYRGKCDEEYGLPYINVGMGGADSWTWEAEPNWIRFRAMEKGYTVVTADESMLEVSYHTANDNGGERKDRLVLRQPSTPRSPLPDPPGVQEILEDIRATRTIRTASYPEPH